jgi:hypothetical protein
MLRDPVQSVGLSRQFDVVGDIGLLADQFVWLDDKAVDVPSDYLKGEITNHGRKNRRDHQLPRGTVMALATAMAAPSTSAAQTISIPVSMTCASV